MQSGPDISTFPPKSLSLEIYTSLSFPNPFPSTLPPELYTHVIHPKKKIRGVLKKPPDEIKKKAKRMKAEKSPALHTLKYDHQIRLKPKK
jgi:hypothetical protein